MNEEEHCLNIGDEKIEYVLVKKRIKNMNMRILDDGRLKVSLPMRMDKSDAEKFIKMKITWILKQKKKIHDIKNYRESSVFVDEERVYYLGKQYILKLVPSDTTMVEVYDEVIRISVKKKYYENQSYIQRIYNTFLKEKCYEYCEYYVLKYFEEMKRHRIPLPEIKIKNFKARWGCCIPSKKMVKFSTNLVKTPLECLEYVVIHELTHFKYIYHDNNFYNFVSLYMPDWKKKRKLLNDVYGKIVN